MESGASSSNIDVLGAGESMAKKKIGIGLNNIRDSRLPK